MEKTRKNSTAPEEGQQSPRTIDLELLEAIREGTIETISGIVASRGTTIGEFRLDNSTLLHLAVQYGPSNLTSILVPLVDVNIQRPSDGFTALHMAAAMGRIATIEALLRPDSNVDETIRNNSGETATDVACTKSVETAIRYGIARFAETMAREVSLALSRKDVNVLASILSNPRTTRNLSLNDLDATGENFLHRAAKIGQPDLNQLLLDAGADPFVKSRKGKMAFEMTNNEEIRRRLKTAPMVTGSDTRGGEGISGYLLKYVNIASGYKRRYVTLEDGVLSYYRSKEEYPVSCKGSLNVQFARLIQPPGSLTSFELRTEKATLYFKADGEAEAKKWIIALSGWQRRIGDIGEVANKLKTRSRSSIGVHDDEEYKKTLLTALDCLAQLEEHLVRTSVTNPTAVSTQENGHHLEPTTEKLLRSLRDFFKLCEQRELYWQERLSTEQRQRMAVEESKRCLLKSLKNVPPSTGAESFMDTADEDDDAFDDPTADEFYDAMEEILSPASLPLSSSKTSLCNPKPETLDEVPGLVVAVPSSEIGFVKASLVGYEPIRRDKIPVDMTKIPPISIWSMIKNAIGKDLTKIPVPVNFSEPLSMLQRLCEDVEYADLLYMASTSRDPLLRLQYVAAFAVSPYCNTYDRIKKPFNPLLGETYEYVSHEHGFRYISEQVSHHPPISACHCESERYIYNAEVAVKTKFWGKSLELAPEGLNHLYLKGLQEHYSWRKVNTAVYGLMFGKLWIDNFGTLRVRNHATGEYAEVEFKATGWTTSDHHRIEGYIYDACGTAKYTIYGYWTKFLLSKNLATGEERELWRRRPVPSWSDKIYNFSYFAMTLNEMTPEMKNVLCPTDCRLRPDQRAMEDGEFNQANELKVKLEEKQRTKRKQWETDPDFTYRPRWFRRGLDPDTGEPFWDYQGDYWECREKKEWPNCLDIFLTEAEVSSVTSGVKNS